MATARIRHAATLAATKAIRCHVRSRRVRTISRVEERRGSVDLLIAAPFPLPAHRTQRADFPHCALGLVSRAGMRHTSTTWRDQTNDPELIEDRRV
jgi:hypothetical protein